MKYTYKHHNFPWYCYVFFHGIWLVFMFFMVCHCSRFTIVNDAIFFAKSSGPMFLKFNDHRMQLFPMVGNHRPTDVMIAMYRSTPDLLSSCQQHHHQNQQQNKRLASWYHKQSESLHSSLTGIMWGSALVTRAVGCPKKSKVHFCDPPT